VNVLQAITSGLNNTYSESLGMTPIEASKPKNHDLVFHKKFHKLISSKPIIPKFKSMQPVRIAKTKISLGDKSYTQNYTNEIYFISEALPGLGPTRYKLKDSQGKNLQSSFYDQELNPVTI
jgi:hypothetical protein